MLEIALDCAQCGKRFAVINTDKVDDLRRLEAIITDLYGIVQINGEHFDVYCSRECAK